MNEGTKYYLRDISWVGNTVYPTDQLSRVLGMNKGDVYNQKLMEKRLSQDEDAVGNMYWNNGYLFYNLQPTEVNIVGDSIDLEMRITENRKVRRLTSATYASTVTTASTRTSSVVNCEQSLATSSPKRHCNVHSANSHPWATSIRKR